MAIPPTTLSAKSAAAARFLAVAAAVAALLALATFAAGLVGLGRATYLGAGVEPLLADAQVSGPWLLLGVGARLVALYAAGLLLALLWAEGCLLGLDASGRPAVPGRWQRRWGWRLGLAALAGALAWLEAAARFPAFVEETSPGRLFGLGLGLAVAVGPLWLAPLLASPLGLLLFILKRIGPGAWRLAPVAALAPLTAFCLWGRSRTDPLPAPAAPNVLLLVGDSLRGDRLTPETAPTVLALARRGVFVPRWRVSLARTETAWVSILSGEWPLTHGVRQMFPSAAERRRPHPSFVRALAARGYRTLVVGDYGSETFHLSDLGFGELDVARFDLDALVEAALWRTQPLLAAVLAVPWADHLAPALRADPSYANPDRVTTRLLDRLDAQPAGQPFAAVAIYSATHLPFAAPYPYYDAGRGGPLRFAKRDLVCDAAPPDKETVADVRALYDAGVRAFDGQVARVVEYLRARGALDHTVIVVLGDHGEELYDDGETLGHGDHLAGVANQTALIFAGPGIAASPVPVDVRLRDVDLAPTLAALFDLGPWPGPGESFVDLLRSGARPADRDMYYETGIWLDEACPLSWQRQRISYPEITALVDVDRERFLHLRPSYRDLVLTAKHRAVETNAGRLTYAPTSFGARWTLDGAPVGGAALASDPRVAALRRTLERFTAAAGEAWVGDRILPDQPQRGPEPPRLLTLELSHGIAEEGSGHYQGVLSFPEPVPAACAPNAGFEETRAVQIDRRLAPGETSRCVVRLTRPGAEQVCQATLDLSFDGVPLSGRDLFTGGASVRPFESLGDLDLCRHEQALLDHGGVHPSAAVWLGLR